MTRPRTPLQTAHLRLEPIDATHLDGLFAAIEASRPELRPWMPWADVDREAEAEFLRAAAAAWDEDQLYAFAIIHADRVLGTIGLHVPQAVRWTGELGYWLRSDAAGQGHTTEAAQRIVEFAFDDLGLQRLELLAGLENTASRRIAEKLGFREEGIARGAAFGASGMYDCVAYGLLASDRQAAGAAPASPTGPDFSHGLVAAVAQDHASGEVLMLAHMNEAAYKLTLETGRAWFWSRSRNELWEKGATSGNYLDVISVTVDCDGDAVLLGVTPHGPACHTGQRSCFHKLQKAR